MAQDHQPAVLPEIRGRLIVEGSQRKFEVLVCPAGKRGAIRLYSTGRTRVRRERTGR
jgi:hypothetical protein